MFSIKRIITIRTVKDIDGEKQVFTKLKAAFVGAKIVSPGVVVIAVAKPALQIMHNAYLKGHRNSGSGSKNLILK
jgi:hypothetical protein